MSGVMSERRIPAKVKGKIHQTVIQPALLYGLEMLPQTKKTIKRLEVAEMKMCRWACGKTRRDRERNENIRERMKVTNIGVRCRRARLRWFGHVKRREESYVGRRLLSMGPPGLRIQVSLTSHSPNKKFLATYLPMMSIDYHKLAAEKALGGFQLGMTLSNGGIPVKGML